MKVEYWFCVYLLLFISLFRYLTLYPWSKTIAFVFVPDHPHLDARLQEAGGPSPAVEVSMTRSLASGHRGQGGLAAAQSGIRGGRGHRPHHCTRLCHCGYLTIVPCLTLTPIFPVIKKICFLSARIIHDSRSQKSANFANGLNKNIQILDLNNAMVLWSRDLGQCTVAAVWTVLQGLQLRSCPQYCPLSLRRCAGGDWAVVWPAPCFVPPSALLCSLPHVPGSRFTSAW